MEIVWEGGDEEDEELDTTLQRLEDQGVIPGTPTGMMSTPKNQDTGKRAPFYPPMTVKMEDDLEDNFGRRQEGRRQ